jgi:putative ABC transport system permease protein
MLLETFLQDLRIGLRVLIKEKGFCALAVAILALGIAAVTTQFSVINGVMLRGFSFPNADRLMGIRFIDPNPAQANFFGPANQIFALDYQDLAAHQASFERVAAYIGQSTVNVTHSGNPRRYTGAYVTEDFFRVLGVSPALGRDFTAADNTPGAEKVTLISHTLWQRDFGGNPDVIGAGIRLNGRPATIIGVMPPGFAFPINEELWIPFFSEFPPRPRNARGAAGQQVSVLALLRPDVSIAQANNELTLIARRLAREFADTNERFDTGQVQPLIKNFTPQQLQNLLFTMFAVCLAVLLLACANVMNMQFARATLRAKELAIRSSLGATRARLVRQMLTESLLLAAIGAVVGVQLAFYAVDLLEATARTLQPPVPAYMSFSIDGRVLVLVVLITVLAAVISGVLPAWMASRASAADVLKESGRGNTSRAVAFATRGLVIVQILLTCVILVAALLQFQSIVRQQKLDYGFDTNGVLMARMGLMDGDYPDSEARRQFYDRLVRELRASPEIESAALTSRLRMAFAGTARIEIEGREYHEDRDRPNVNFENVTDGYFGTLGVKLLEGRDFTADDTDLRQPVAIVNATFARRHFGRESAVGRRFRTVANNGHLFGPWRTIVGVVSDVRMLPPFNVPGTEEYGFYLPYYSTAFGPPVPQLAASQFTTVVVRPRGTPAANFGNPLRRTVNRVDPHLPLYFVDTPAVLLDSFLGQNRIIATMFFIFGVVATVLAAAGLYGMMSFSVNQRTQEFGIRMALGADQRRILTMVMRQGITQLGIGLAAGLGLTAALGIAFGTGLRNQLVGISPTDPLTYGAVALLLALVALIATLVPARRATRVDPMIALRAE